MADASVVPNDYVLPTYAVAAVANPFQHSKNASMLNNYLHLVYNQKFTPIIYIGDKMKKTINIEYKLKKVSNLENKLESIE